MKQFVHIYFFILITSFTLHAQEHQISSLLYKFSPLGEIIIHNLGMNDINGNGVIDKGTGEGYEEFVEKYGIGETFEEKEKSIDRGFHANSIIFGAGNGRLEEDEIVNFYYINIRFNPLFFYEETIIENEIKAYIYANNLPLIWMDDEQNTVMNAVNSVLGEGWNDPEIERTDAELEALYRRALQGLRITGRTGMPSGKGGYYTLSEMVNRRAGYCVEVAQFGFWFFSELRVNSISKTALLTRTLSHQIIGLTRSIRNIDYFRSSERYRVPENRWSLVNPMHSIALYYKIFSKITQQKGTYEELSFIYNKNDLFVIASIIQDYLNIHKYADIISLGEFFLENTNLDVLLRTNNLDRDLIRMNVRAILLFMANSYSNLNNPAGFQTIADLIIKHYPNDREARNYVNFYSF